MNCPHCGAEIGFKGATNCPQCRKPLRSSDRAMRNRGGVITNSQRQGLRNSNVNNIIKPVNYKGISVWNGSRNQIGGFTDLFVDNFLTAYYTLPNAYNKKNLQSRIVHGIKEYQCVKCGAFVTRKNDAALGARFITIDHIKPILDYVMLHTTARTKVVNNHRWTFYYLHELKQAHLSYANLQPMCNVCNSSEGGTKEIDKDGPVHNSSNCPGCGTAEY